VGMGILFGKTDCLRPARVQTRAEDRCAENGRKRRADYRLRRRTTINGRSNAIALNTNEAWERDRIGREIEFRQPEYLLEPGQNHCRSRIVYANEHCVVIRGKTQEAESRRGFQNRGDIASAKRKRRICRNMFPRLRFGLRWDFEVALSN